jgi:hypothetical protein
MQRRIAGIVGSVQWQTVVNEMQDTVAPDLDAEDFVMQHGIEAQITVLLQVRPVALHGRGDGMYMFGPPVRMVVIEQ